MILVGTMRRRGANSRPVGAMFRLGLRRLNRARPDRAVSTLSGVLLSAGARNARSEATPDRRQSVV